MKRTVLITIILLSILPLLWAKPFSFQNEINLTVSDDNFYGYWRPELNLQFFDNQKFKLDSKITPSLMLLNSPGHDMELDLDLYRLWGRISTDSWYLRVGRQKFNFGSAKYLRPLQWFDTIDPLDPLKQSIGIDAALLRYYLGTANLWLWIAENGELYSSNYASEKDKLNFGARIENSLTYCDAALTTNFLQTENSGLESKLGIDIRWDSTFGYWIESSITNYAEPDEVEWDKFITLGADYTINAGNGIYAMLEFMNRAKSETSILVSDQDYCYTALSMNYPVSIISNLNFSCITNWKYEYNILNFTMDFSTDYFRFIPYLNWSNSHDDLIDSSNIEELGLKTYLNF